MPPDCFLCRTGEGSRKWFDEPIYASDIGVVVPALGSLEREYVLLAPRQHVPSVLALERDVLLRFAQWAIHIFNRLQGVSESFLYWEHGGSDGSLKQPQSSCVAHAHIHVAFGDFELEGPASLLIEEFPHLADLLENASIPPGQPYVLEGSTTRGCRLYHDPGVSQYFRRQWARSVDNQLTWDYAAFPAYEIAKETVENLQRHPCERGDNPDDAV
jgi:hypothetical protein